MEDNNSIQQMEALGGLLKSTSPLEKVAISSQASHFELYFKESVVDKAGQVKAIHEFVQVYLVEHGILQGCVLFISIQSGRLKGFRKVALN